MATCDGPGRLPLPPLNEPNATKSAREQGLMMELWPQVLERLSNELPEQQVNTWLRPLQAVQEDGVLRLLAPNRFAVDWVQSNAAERIGSMLRDGARPGLRVVVEI